MSFSHKSRKKNPLISLAIGTGALLVGAAAAYYYREEISEVYQTASSKISTNEKNKRYHEKRSIAVVLSASIISANIPLAEILSNISKVVFILPPGLNKDDLKDFNIDVKDSYKIIECETELGIFHALKHLKFSYNMICPNDLSLSLKELDDLQLKQFLPNIIYLDQNNEMINEEFLKLIFC